MVVPAEAAGARAVTVATAAASVPDSTAARLDVDLCLEVGLCLTGMVPSPCRGVTNPRAGGPQGWVVVHLI
ncbi:hypothetical protein GCM10009839_15910 [Catenulispora yoronensis]|uniref:Uncharacterized protein n=1 Tax=Catenulispora yoronensis TaxID=450799 RepID=A0ABN2TTY2_9ACTN